MVSIFHFPFFVFFFFAKKKKKKQNLKLGNKWNFSKFVGYRDMIKLIEEKFPGHLQKVADDPNDTTKVKSKQKT